MKKPFCLLCLMTQTALAAPPTGHTFTGYYLTGAVGATSARFDIAEDITMPPPVFLAINSNEKDSRYATSPSGLLGLEYLYQLGSHFVLGVQATAGYMKAQENHQTHFNEAVPIAPLTLDFTHELDIELTNDIAILAKLGIVWRQNTLFYTTLGPRWGNFQTSLSSHYLLTVGSGTLAASGSDEESGYERGFTVGAGIQQMLTDHVHLSLDYAYTRYGDIDSPEIMSEVITLGVPSGFFLTDTPDVDASTNTLMLAVSYQW